MKLKFEIMSTRNYTEGDVTFLVDMCTIVKDCDTKFVKEDDGQTI